MSKIELPKIQDDAYTKGLDDGEKQLLSLLEEYHKPYVGIDDALWCSCGWSDFEAWIDHIKNEYGAQ